jgi:hypothetical protein
VPLLCRSPSRRSSIPQPPSPSAAASCRGPGCRCPLSRHYHAAALGSQDPRACVRTVPRHDPAMALPCTVTTRRGRDVAFTLRPSPLGHSLEHARGACHTHTLALTHTTTQGPSRTGSGSHTRSGGRPTSGLCLSGETWGAAPWARVVKEREGEESDRPRAGLSRPARLACPRTRAGLRSRRPS